MKKTNNKKEKAFFSAGVGAGLGFVASQAIGRIGIAAMGTAIGVGLGPFVVAGTVVGLAVHGVKSAMERRTDSISDIL